MKNTQLTEILKSFNKTELKEFGKFVHSPYFNNRNEVIRFFDSVKKYHPDFDSKDFTEVKIFESVYPGKKYSPVLMRKLISLTNGLLTDFIAVKGFKENESEYNLILLDKLRERKLPVIFEKKAKSLDELLNKGKRDIFHYETRLKLTSILNGHYFNTNEKDLILGIQKELDDLIEYFLIAATLQYIRIGEWSKAFSKKFDMKFYDEVINYFSTRNGNEITIAFLYFNMMMLLNTEEEKYYYELLNCREKLDSKLSDMDAYNIAIVLNQYCYKEVLKGNTEFRKNQFEITKTIIDKNLIPPGYIEPYFFTNVVRNATSLKEFKWTEYFITEYMDRLKPGLKEEITDYSYAMIESGKGNFEKSLKHLSKINIERSNMKLDIKNLLIVIYYEMNYTEELISLIDTHRHFLQRDKNIPEHTKSINSLFLKYVSDLVKIHFSNNTESAFLLKKKIENASYFGQKDWLLKKAEELIS